MVAMDDELAATVIEAMREAFALDTSEVPDTMIMSEASADAINGLLRSKELISFKSVR